ncbi:MAG: hydrolase, partial [Firmicutes bacterium]|nr:hydrolase [Bacillota bacterium]
MANDLIRDMKKTALVVIDLQKGIVALKGAPHSSQQVLENAGKLAQAFRRQGGFVVLVNVGSQDGKDMLQPVVDQAAAWSGDRPKDWMDLAPELDASPTDHRITKHQWGAFYGTDLDLQLRRRGIDTIVLCGISTNIGVETTAREAYQHNYQQIFVEDAMTAMSDAEHRATLQYIFPRIGRVRT